MKEIALIVFYLVGMLVCQVHVMIKNQETERWEVFYMVLSLLSWVGWMIFLLIIKINRWKY